MADLLLSLGHNSSAVLIGKPAALASPRARKVFAGYEEERLSKVKSDSRFPVLAINECIDAAAEQGEDPTIDRVYVSHWFVDGKLPEAQNKYWDPMAYGVMAAKYVVATDQGFTHHDAHAWSGLWFSKMEFGLRPNCLTIVADGFGNFGECVSIYRNTPVPKLMHRAFGFDCSLGMLYQYTTAYIGLKEHQDEYKMLGLEAHIHEMSSAVGREMAVPIKAWAEDYAHDMFLRIMGRTALDVTDPMVSLAALPQFRMKVYNTWDTFCKILGVEDAYKPVAIAYALQCIAESVTSLLLLKFNPTNVILAGGFFYNVKVNSLVANYVGPKGGMCSIMPIAGDQGAPIGLWYKHNFDCTLPHDDFLWGYRTHRANDTPLDHSIEVVGRTDDAARCIGRGLRAGQIINIVRGNMEFGPRALCNTSTLAMPTIENVRYINMMNERSEVMPMAPVLTQAAAFAMMDDVEYIHESLKFMVCTRKWKPTCVPIVEGASHRDPAGGHTGRPQLTYDDFLIRIMMYAETDVLINTSWNEHGQPIIYSTADANRCHAFESVRDTQGKLETFWITEGKP